MRTHDTYLKLTTLDERLEFLKQRYPGNSRVQATTIKGVKGLLGDSFTGLVERSDIGYSITVGSDDKMNGYLTLHEFQHIELEEGGLTFAVGQELDEDIQGLVFELRNMINDVLIESRINRFADGYYGEDVNFIRNRDVLGQFAVRNENGVQILILGITALVIQRMYPQSRYESGLNIREVFGFIKFENKSLILEELSRLKEIDFSEMSKDDYLELYKKIFRLLTGIDVDFSDGILRIDNIEGSKEYIAHVNQTFGTLISLLAGRLRS